MAYPPIPHPISDAKTELRVTVPWRKFFENLVRSAAAAITQLTGDVTTPPGGGVVAATLSNTGVAAGTYGDSTHVGQFTVDAKGRLTFAQNVLIAAGSSGAFMAAMTDDGGGDTTYQMLGSSATSSGTVCSPLTDGDATEPELIFALGDCIMVCS